MSDIPFTCKNCGTETFKVSKEPTSLDDFEGAVCENCGTKLSNQDIEEQAQQIALNMLKDAGFNI